MIDEAKKNELMNKAYDLGYEYEKVYRGCSQCSVAALQDVLGIRDDRIFKAATALAGGGGLTTISACGGYSGSMMVLSQLCGRERDQFDDTAGIRRKSFALGQKYTDAFVKEIGSVICRDIHMLRFGRPYYIADPDEFKKFEEAGAHERHCPDVVGRACRIAVQLILDEGLIDPS